MTLNRDIRDELNELRSSLVDMPMQMPYYVPPGYFDGLANAALRSVKDEFGALPLQPVTPYVVPEGYFEQLATQVLANINAGSAMHVPEGYFENLPGDIMAAIRREEAAQSTKVIPLGRMNVWRSVRWAAAAMLVVAAGLGLYRITMTPNTQPYDANKALAMVSDEAVSNYVLNHIDEFETEDLMDIAAVNEDISLSPTLDDEDIEQYLDETGWDGQTELKTTTENKEENGI